MLAEECILKVYLTQLAATFAMQCNEFYYLNSGLFASDNYILLLLHDENSIWRFFMDETKTGPLLKNPQSFQKDQTKCLF
jgi:hypothetical protein